MFDHLPELAESLAAVSFTVLGAVAELNAAGSLADGQTTIGLWFAYVGAVALYGGLFVAGDGLLGSFAGSATGDE
jgi:hypothetical protein